MSKDAAGVSESVTRFTFNQTLESDMVHRSAVSEVFITDYVAVDDDNWFVGAQLPTAHSYYSDLWAGGASSCPLLLVLECCRQAATYGSYSRFGNSSDTVNMIKSMRIDIPEIGSISCAEEPARLVIGVEATELIVRNGVRKGATPKIAIYHEGSLIGSSTIPVALASKRLFASLRKRQRGSAPVSTRTLPRERPADAVDPKDLGLSNAENVVIASPRFSRPDLVTELALVAGNKSLLDHEYDHIPAMALIEGARQTAMLAMQECWPFAGVGAIENTSLQAAFEQFAEVDEQTEFVTAIPEAARNRTQATIDIQARQRDAVVADFEFGFNRRSLRSGDSDLGRVGEIGEEVASGRSGKR